MGMYNCGCSLKSKCLTAGVTSLVASVMVLFFSVKEVMFGSDLIDPKMKTDVIVVSAVAIIFTVVLIGGILKESRHLFLPWLFFFAIGISVFFLYSLYLIVFNFQTEVLTGCILFVVAALSYYGWLSVAAFYSQLKENETERDIERRYSQVVATDATEIFMRPRPPPYSISYENPLAYEKPPPYDEVRSSEENRY